MLTSGTDVYADVRTAAVILAGAVDADRKRIEAARRKRDLGAKFRGMIHEIVWQIIMLALFTLVIVGSLDANVYYQNQDIRSAFIDDAEVTSLKILGHYYNFPNIIRCLLYRKMFCALYMYVIVHTYVRLNIDEK